MTERLGVAVCTYRRPAGLARMLAALPDAFANQPEPPVVLVVDNDGTDPAVAAAVAAAPSLDLRLFVEPAPGISAARNRAFAEAEAAGVTLLALLDDDEWPAPHWLDALLACRRETGAAVVGGRVDPVFPAGAVALERYRRFWSVLPQYRSGRPFVHATSNVLVDLATLDSLPRPLFDDAHGLSGGGDTVFFSRLFDRGVPMAWAESARAHEEVPPARASLAWLARRRHRVGNHMVMDEETRHGRLRPLLKTAGLLARLPVYPLLSREPECRLLGWRMEAQKLRGRLAAHRGLRSYDYPRDGVTLRPLAPAPPQPRPVDPGEVIVAIPALDEADHIAACLETLAADPWMAGVPLVVADGGSRDATRVVVRALQPRLPGLRLIDNIARLQSAAINRVADTAGGRRYLVRCDAHATYPPGYVRRVVETLAALPEDVASVTTVMDARGDTAFARAAAWAVDTPLGSGGAGHRGGRASGFVDHGHHAGFRLAWLARVGGYDESFAINEDAELDHRLRAAGARIWLDATLRLGYAMRPTPTALARQYWRYGRGRAATLLKHRTRPRLRQLAPAGLVLALGTSLAAAPAFPALLALPAAYAAVLGAAALAACHSLRSPAGLWAAPALAILHTAWGAGFLARIATGSRRSADARAASNATVATPGA